MHGIQSRVQYPAPLGTFCYLHYLVSGSGLVLNKIVAGSYKSLFTAKKEVKKTGNVSEGFEGFSAQSHGG